LARWVSSVSLLFSSNVRIAGTAPPTEGVSAPSATTSRAWSSRQAARSLFEDRHIESEGYQEGYPRSRDPTGLSEKLRENEDRSATTNGDRHEDCAVRQGNTTASSAMLKTVDSSAAGLVLDSK
jgi:hypothetical protein